MILVSACLVGLNCRFDGKSSPHPLLTEILPQGKLLPLCPEQLGGLPTPRLPAEIAGGTAADIIYYHLHEQTPHLCPAKVINQAGKDVTPCFIRGAQETLYLAQKAKAKTAILKARSPSCGHRAVYDGSFRKKIVPHNGITTELLVQNHIQVFTEEELTDELLEQLTNY